MTKPRPTTNRFTRHPLRTAAGLFISVLVALEIVLRILAPGSIQFAHDARQIYRYHSRWYTDFIPDTNTHFYLRDSTGAPTLDFPASINQYGFRTKDRTTLHQPPPSPRAESPRTVHAIGDSFTMGWGVDYQSSYPAQLSESLGQETQVLNLGLNGFGAIGATEKSLSLFGDRSPDAVIYLVTENDYEDDAKTTRHARHSRLVHRVFDLANWFRRHSYLASTPFALRHWLRFDRLEAPNSGAEVKPGPSKVEQIAESANTLRSDPARGEATKIALESYWNTLQQQHIPFLVVLHGDGSVVRDLAAFCKEHNIAARRITFPNHLLLPGDGHLNRTGNRALASFLEPWVQSVLDFEEAAPQPFFESSVGQDTNTDSLQP